MPTEGSSAPGLFTLTPSWATRPFRGGSAAGWDATDRFQRGEAPAADPFEFQWISGEATPGPVVWVNFALLLVRVAVLQQWQEAGLTGFVPRMASVVDRRGVRHEDYVALSIVGRCGPVDLSATRVEIREYPGGWFPRIVGPSFSPAAWDGSDFFGHAVDSRGEYTLRLFCSDRARRAISSIRRHGCRFEPVDADEWSSFLPDDRWLHALPDYASRVRQAYRDAGLAVPKSVEETLITLEPASAAVG